MHHAWTPENELIQRHEALSTLLGEHLCLSSSRSIRRSAELFPSPGEAREFRSNLLLGCLVRSEKMERRDQRTGAAHVILSFWNAGRVVLESSCMFGATILKTWSRHVQIIGGSKTTATPSDTGKLVGDQRHHRRGLIHHGTLPSKGTSPGRGEE